jgi:uroporphyrinogen-III synthase
LGRLDRTWVVVTRPAHQAGPLLELIEAEGGHAVSFPTLEIRPPRDPRFLEKAVRDLHTYDVAIFVSPNAVTHAVPTLLARGPLPPDLRIAAVGRGSARALQQLGVETHIVPTARFDSEALLQTPELQNVAGKRVVIFRGDGGREILAGGLAARGADVDYVECYRRTCPDTDDRLLAEHWARHQLDVFVVTSNAALLNLFTLVDTARRDALLHTPMVVISRRMADECRHLGWRAAVVVAEQASDGGLLDALIRWHNQRM